MNAKDTEPLDATTLAQFTGTAQYWRVARQFAITDGVKYLAETAACFWLIDAAISHLLEIGTADWFVLVRTEVFGSSAVMIYEDGNGAEHAGLQTLGFEAVDEWPGVCPTQNNRLVCN